MNLRFDGRMVDNRAAMTNPDRLTGLDASFLALEDAGAHMHVGSCMLFEGEAPDYDDFVAQLETRLHLVPRYRQKLAFPPLTQARPVWVDDPHFNPGYHVRHTALPEPASLEQLRNLTGRVLAQRLDRTKPLWEIWLVQRVEGGRFAMISKTHHCLRRATSPALTFAWSMATRSNATARTCACSAMASRSCQGSMRPRQAGPNAIRSASLATRRSSVCPSF